MVRRILKTLLLITLLYVGPLVVRASFEITEIMYDLDGTDTNREWIEVKNTGSDPADLSTWYFFSDNSKHALTPQGVSQVPAGGYAIIAQNAPKFKMDWPNFSGLLFDSSWTGFNNDEETIALKDSNLTTVSEVTFASSQGGAGNGDSLQKINSAWSGGTPTLGADNQAGSSTTTSSTSSTTTLTTATAPVVKKKEMEVPKITTNIVTTNTAVAGLELKMSSTTSGYGKEPLKYGRFSWNFGDGMTKDQSEAQDFTYIYAYPGEYVVTLTYYRYYYSTTPDATDRLTISVIPSEISINSVGPSSDPFIELENKSAVEVDLSKWRFQSGSHIFSIPQGTIILASKKLRFSPKVTLFTPSDVASVILYNQAGEIFATYPIQKPIRPSVVHTIPSSTPSLSQPTSLGATEAYTPTPPVINLNDLGASVVNPDRKDSQAMVAWIGLVGVIILGLITVFIMRRRNATDTTEEEIRATDMTIVE